MNMNLQFPNNLTPGHYVIFRGMIKDGHVREVGRTKTSVHFTALTTKGRIFFEWLKLTQAPAVTVA